MCKTREQTNKQTAKKQTPLWQTTNRHSVYEWIMEAVYACDKWNKSVNDHKQRCWHVGLVLCITVSLLHAEKLISIEIYCNIVIYNNGDWWMQDLAEVELKVESRVVPPRAVQGSDLPRELSRSLVILSVMVVPQSDKFTTRSASQCCNRLMRNVVSI